MVIIPVMFAHNHDNVESYNLGNSDFWPLIWNISYYLVNIFMKNLLIIAVVGTLDYDSKKKMVYTAKRYGLLWCLGRKVINIPAMVNATLYVTTYDYFLIQQKVWKTYDELLRRLIRALICAARAKPPIKQTSSHSSRRYCFKNCSYSLTRVAHRNHLSCYIPTHS